MTRETRNESVPGKVTSIAPKPLNNPHLQVKVTSMAVPATHRPAFLYSYNMLPAELRNDIDKKWDACWPINALRPLVLLDLISYLLFIKELDERQLISGKITELLGNLISAKEKDELNWNTFKDMAGQSRHELFTKEKGFIELIRKYSLTNYRYSLFVKEPLLLTPTAGMLTNMVDIIKIMEPEENRIKAAIFEYLVNKAEITAQNGQVYAPDYIVKLMVALMQPVPEDVIGDPSAGNGSLLVNSAMYISNRNSAAIPNFKNHFVTNIYKGIESDLIQLRIGAMNMILHGIEDPKIESLHIFSKTNISIREQPTLIVSNLFFEGTEDKITARAETSKTETGRQEIPFLNFIIKNLKRGGRAAIIIREIILYDNIADIKTMRQQIIDDHKLEAVISVPGKAGSLFTGACILIFTKQEINTTDKVWFYKMETRKQVVETKDPDPANADKNVALPFTAEHDDVTDILSRWKNEKESAGIRTDKSFFITVDEIRTNNYNLNYNEYRRTAKEFEQHTRNKTLATEKETGPVVTPQKPAEPHILPAEPSAKPAKSYIEPVLPSIKPAAAPSVKPVAPKPIAPPVKPIVPPVKSTVSSVHPAKPFVKKIPLPAKRAPLTRKFSTLFILLIIIGIGLSFYFIYFNDKKSNAVNSSANNTIPPASIKNPIPSGKIKPEQSANKPITAVPTEQLSSERIKAILKDTTGIIHFQNQVSALSPIVKDSEKSLARNSKATILNNKRPEPAVTPENALLTDKRPEPVPPGNALKTQYTVVDTTFFHDLPDESTRRKSFLDPLNNNVLTPVKDKNGFIFVVYTNRFGRTSKGWISKKNLKPVR